MSSNLLTTSASLLQKEHHYHEILEITVSRVAFLVKLKLNKKYFITAKSDLSINSSS